MTCVPPCGHHECRESTACLRGWEMVRMPLKLAEISSVELDPESDRILRDNLFSLYVKGDDHDE